MKKEYIILAIMILLLVFGLWFFFFKSGDKEERTLESDNNQFTTLNDVNSGESLDETIRPDGVEDYQEILIGNNNMVRYTIGESLANIETGYTVSSEESEVSVTTGSIKVLRPFDIIKLRKKETKTGDEMLIAISQKNTKEVVLNAKSSAIALVVASIPANKRLDMEIIRQIASNQNTQKLANLISDNLAKNSNISPLDMDTYPEISKLIDLVKKDVIVSL